MSFIADLHVHSHYSRATSRDMVPQGLWRWAQLKGISIIGTGDFTHPQWFKELTDKLDPMGNGLFSLKKGFQDGYVPESCRGDVSFLLTGEISCIYKKNGRTRKVHCLVLVPDFATAAKVNVVLAGIGNISSDGRPILGLDAKELLKIVLQASSDSVFVPAHIWTPHFSVFGAASGFESLEECFEELSPHIFAAETGLSSDPAMNWRWSVLDGITLISNSDAHSATKIGREANVFETDFSYRGVTDAIKTRRGFQGTIEFFPEEGKYHYDGHRPCNVSLPPGESIRHGLRCPVCGGKVTIGVMHRVEKLADREVGFMPPGVPGYRSVIPLTELLSETMKVGPTSKAVNTEYMYLLTRMGSEFHILLDAPLAEIQRTGPPLLGEAISRMRQGKVNIEPGYDGEYGKVRIFEAIERKALKGQGTLL